MLEKCQPVSPTREVSLLNAVSGRGGCVGFFSGRRVLPGTATCLPHSHPKTSGSCYHVSPPFYRRGVGKELTHVMRPTDFLEVTELVSGDLGPEAPCPDSGSDWLPDAGVGDASGGMNDEPTSGL